MNRLEKLRFWLIAKLCPKGYHCFVVSEGSRREFDYAILAVQLAREMTGEIFGEQAVQCVSKEQIH